MARRRYARFLSVHTMDHDEVMVRVKSIISVVRPLSLVRDQPSAHPPGWIIRLQSPADGIHISDAEGERVKDYLMGIKR